MHRVPVDHVLYVTDDCHLIATVIIDRQANKSSNMLQLPEIRQMSGGTQRGGRAPAFLRQPLGLASLKLSL